MYLGIDLGTSGVKVVIIDDQNNLIAQASAALTVSIPQPLWSEQEPLHWWQATNKAMTERLGITKEECVGQTCYSCAHGTDAPEISISSTVRTKGADKLRMA